MNRNLCLSVVIVLGLAMIAPAHAQDPANAIAPRILDDTLPEAARRELVDRHSSRSAELILAMTKRLRDDHEEEYRRIPWIWRVAIAAGRRDRPSEQRRVLDVALPADDGKLDDWRAVVIGGGLINGVSLNGTWPRDRFEELLREDESLRARWNRALELASTMADDEKIPTGTRYDALRMLGVEPWERRGEQIAKYLAKDTHPELQMGAVSALADVRHPEATTALVNAYEGLEAGNRPLAIDALLRDDDRAARLLDAIAAKRIPVDDLGPERSAKLRTHENAMIRQKAIETLDAKKE